MLADKRILLELKKSINYSIAKINQSIKPILFVSFVPKCLKVFNQKQKIQQEITLVETRKTHESHRIWNVVEGKAEKNCASVGKIGN